MRLRLLTYNIHRAIGVDRQFRPERIIRIISHYGADVVLLQEVDDGVPRSREMDMARELADALDYPYWAVGHNVLLRKGRYGNATFSRFPILAERNIDLTIGWRKRRGCQHTSLRVPGVEPLVEVFNVHLGLSARERIQQVDRLSAAPEFRDLDPLTPCVVAGDFNDWRSMLRDAFTRQLGFRCATDRTRRLVRALRTYPSFSPSGPLDRIYHRGPIHLVAARRCRMPLSRVASDHLPVIADFVVLDRRSTDAATFFDAAYERR